MPITYVVVGAIGGVMVTALVALPVVIAALLIVKRKQRSLMEIESSHTQAYNNPKGKEVLVMQRHLSSGSVYKNRRGSLSKLIMKVLIIIIIIRTYLANILTS